MSYTAVKKNTILSVFQAHQIYIVTIKSRITLQVLPLFIISIVLTGVWLNGIQNSYIPCMQDCGETFYAEHASNNFSRYGLKYGFLEDNSIGSDINRKPYLYTHNVNIGSLVFSICQALGVSSIFAKQLVTLFAFGFGLFYVYRLTSYVTGQRLIGICTLLLFSSEITQVLAFGLNAIRGWHWLGLFGLVFHVTRHAREHNPTYYEKIWIFLFTLICFCLGYEFLAISGLVSLFVVLFCSKKASYGAQTLGWLVVSVLIVFTLRQLQVIYALGFEFWYLDLLYSSAIKLTFMTNFVSIPPLSEIDSLYLNHNVYRPGSSPTPFYQVWLGFAHALKYVTFPTAGFGSTVSLMAGIMLSFCIVCLRKNRPVLFHRQSGLVFGSNENTLTFSCQFYLALLLGIISAIFLFGGLSISIYMKHEFPLLICLFLFPKGVFLTQSIYYLSDHSATQKVGVFVTAIVIFILVDHVITQIENVRAVQAMSVGWIPRVQEKPNASYVISWQPLAIAAFTENWALGIKQGAELRILDRIGRHEFPFTSEDLIPPDQQDTRIAKDISSIKPDYWVYFPFDERYDLKRLWPWVSAIHLFQIPTNKVNSKESFQKFNDALKANTTITVAAKGKDFVIIDLRPLWGNSDKQ